MLSRADSNFRPLPPDAYLTLAVELSQSPSEASRRSAVDRAYYAAFLATIIVLNDHHRSGITRPGTGRLRQRSLPYFPAPHYHFPLGNDAHCILDKTSSTLESSRE